MGEDERMCVACGGSHQAAAWYARKAKDGTVEYLCGARYRTYADRSARDDD